MKANNTFYVGNKKYNCLKNGRHYYRKSVTIEGKRYDFYGDGEKDCLRKIDAAKESIQAGLNYAKRNALTKDIFEHWLYNVKRVDRIKASSFALYERQYRNHIKPYPVMNTVLSKLDSSQLQVYFTTLHEEKKLSGKTIGGVAIVWNMFCKWAQKEGYFVRNPYANLVIPGQRHADKGVTEVFSETEMGKISRYMKNQNYRYETLVRLAFATGMRQGELLGLKWSDVDSRRIRIERSTATVTHVDRDGNRKNYREIWDTKTSNSVRDIPILPETYQMLSSYREQQCMLFGSPNDTPEYLFTTCTGALITASQLYVSFTRMLRNAGVEPRKFHAIRHTFATQALQRGVDIKELQLIMGHADLHTTYGYVTVDLDAKKRAIEKMGRML